VSTPFVRLTRTARRPRGQSLAEFALVVPVMLLLVLVVIDFGRVYLGWVNLQQMVRVAANYAAEHASAWDTPSDAVVLAAYQDLVENDASAINCEPQRNGSGELPGPAFIDGSFALGSRVQVQIACQFTIVTPIISSFIGDADSRLLLSSTIIYPIREGAVAEVPGGGGPIVLGPPTADFFGTPQSGYEPLEVQLVDTSKNNPTSWLWTFGNGSDFSEGPHSRTYECDDTVLPGDSCTFSVSLEVQNSGGTDSETKTDYITVFVPPDTGPIADFVATPRSGTAPLAVDFDFTDVRAGTVVYTNYEWDFTNDGSWDSTGATETSVSHTYPAPGVYDVTLRVTDDGGLSHTLTKTAYIVTARPICTVPDFAGVKVSGAQARWDAAGFTTDVNELPPPAKPPADYKIKFQSIVGGTIDPQPDGCDSQITVGP
jgi:PKD repeat protein